MTDRELSPWRRLTQPRRRWNHTNLVDRNPVLTISNSGALWNVSCRFACLQWRLGIDSFPDEIQGLSRRSDLMRINHSKWETRSPWDLSSIHVVPVNFVQKGCNQVIETYALQYPTGIGHDECSGCTTRGGYSTQMTVPEIFCYAEPDNIPLEYAAPLMSAGITMWTLLEEHVLHAGRTCFAKWGY